MKCDLLIGRALDNGDIYILAADVMEAIAELKAENESLKAKLEDARATVAFNHLDAVTRERRLRRALWLARANWGFAMDDRLTDKILAGDHSDKLRFIRDRWWRMGHKCLKKAEEYK